MASTPDPSENLTSTSPYVVHHHSSATDFCNAAIETLLQEEKSSNILLAHATTRLAESFGTHLLDGGSILPRATGDDHPSPPSPPAAVGPNLWLVMSSELPDSKPLIFLSCLSWELGTYPIFLWSPKANVDIAPEERTKQVTVLVQRLCNLVEPQRVFSVFGQEQLVRVFAELWRGKTGFEIEPKPFYEAFLTYCTKDTFKPASDLDKTSMLPPEHSMRTADMGDLQAVTGLCKEFSDDSIYFPLTLERAGVEAELLITKKQLWVYIVDGKAVSICAVTRTTEDVAGITKVFTTPTSRKQGFAERLVRAVTKLWLEQKSAVVLYVGVTNDAKHVYDKIGFVGLSDKNHQGVERVLELGFKETARGYW